MRRLRRHWSSLLLAASVATISYLIASALFGPLEAFFAPVAAVVCVGLTAGQRTRRAVEIALGVAVGLSAADVLLRLIGTGPLQMGLAVLLSMAFVVCLGASPLMANQAAVAAVLVVSLAPGLATNPFVRLADALIGGGVALLLNAVVAPDPRQNVRRVASEIMDEMIGTVGEVADAIARCDLRRARNALRRGEQLADRVPALEEALATARETARLARHRRRSLVDLRPAQLLDDRLGLMVVTIRALARAAVSAVRHGREVDPRLVRAVETLAQALAEVNTWAGGAASPQPARRKALAAAAAASAIPWNSADLATQVLVGQIRAAAVDVLRATGMDPAAAVSALEEVAGPATAPPD